MKHKYSVIKADIVKYRSIILSILERNSVKISEESSDWKYINCPFGKALCYLALEENTKKFIGVSALFKRKFKLFNTYVSGAVAGNLCVNKEHRTLLPALKLLKTPQGDLIKNNISFSYTFPNKNSKSSVIRSGYSKIGDLNRYVKVLKLTDSAKNFLPYYSVLKYFSFLFNSIIRIFSKETFFCRLKTFLVETPIMFDKRYDKFWEKASKQLDIIGMRDSQFLNWRYIQSPDDTYQIFSLVNEKKAIQGYIVYVVERDVCKIIDMLFLTVDTVFDSLLVEFIGFIRKRAIGFIYINYMGNSKVVRKLREYSFFLIKKSSHMFKNLEESPVMVYTSDKTLKPRLLNKEFWYILTGDCDV